MNLAFLVLLCIFTTVADYIFESAAIKTSPPWLDDTFTVSFDQATKSLSTFCLSVLVYQNLVPISLVISVELVKTMQSWLIYKDLELYYDKTDSPTVPKNYNIVFRTNVGGRSRPNKSHIQ